MSTYVRINGEEVAVESMSMAIDLGADEDKSVITTFQDVNGTMHVAGSFEVKLYDNSEEWLKLMLRPFKKNKGLRGKRGSFLIREQRRSIR